jgi:hypothetical protein
MSGTESDLVLTNVQQTEWHLACISWDLAALATPSVVLEGGSATMTERYPEVGILDKCGIFKPLRRL